MCEFIQYEKESWKRKICMWAKTAPKLADASCWWLPEKRAT